MGKRDKWNGDTGKTGQVEQRYGKGKRDKENGDMGKETRGRKTWEKRNMGMGDMVNKKRG